ncbi:hypothetical protein ABMA28_007242 [Loxostege sticticalis]|uniref:Uncharacterized protein n=1 Tax=Loxostege sticticalis TaxID=481309 RepID=A0ABD0TQE8_LOXSC
MIGISFCLAIFALLNPGQCVSSKMDFGNEETSVVTNSSKTEDEDVEVKHTIVVSTRLKNNNRRGIHGGGDGEAGVLSYNIGRNHKEDSGEVPVVAGYKSVETTQIRTPDSRHKAQIYPDALFVNRNIRDEYDVYPNVALTPSQWKPSSFFNNINWWQQDGRESFESRNYRPISNFKPNRKIGENAMKEFYCKKCRELSQKGCIQQRSNPQPWVEATTPKMKLDGKLAKLN